MLINSAANVDGPQTVTDLNSAALSAICLTSPYSRAWSNYELGSSVLSMLSSSYCFKDSRTSFCMPSFNPTLEFLTRVVDAIVVLLVVDRPGQAVAEHAFCEGRKRVVRVILEEFCSR